MQLDMDQEVAALQQLSTRQLCERYEEVYGRQIRSRHRTYLIRKKLTKEFLRLQSHYLGLADLSVRPWMMGESGYVVGIGCTVFGGVAAKAVRLPKQCAH